MKILNLTNLEASEIKYEVSKFPDGQQQVKLLEFDLIDTPYKWEEERVEYPVEIKARFSTIVLFYLV